MVLDREPFVRLDQNSVKLRIEGLMFLLSDLLPAHKTIGFEAGVGWGGVGWGNTNPTSCYATCSSLVLRHEIDELDATLLDLHLFLLGGVGWGGDDTTHVSCFATGSSFALDATPLDANVYTGGIDSLWTILKGGVPDKLASKCCSKQNPNIWKYLRSAQWHWEVDSVNLLAKTGQQLKDL